MPCRWYLLQTWKSEQAAKDFQVYASKVRKLLTDLLHGHETENAKSHPMLVSRPFKKDCLYCHYF